MEQKVKVERKWVWLESKIGLDVKSLDWVNIELHLH